MRLIDADKLTKRFKQLKGVDSLANMFITDVVKEIQGQPTVEAKEVVHGKWVIFDLAETMSQCTVCGLIVICPPKANTIKFCPDCGADMRTSAE